MLTRPMAVPLTMMSAWAIVASEPGAKDWVLLGANASLPVITTVESYAIVLLMPTTWMPIV